MSGDNGATGLNMAARRVMKCGSRPEKFRCLHACMHGYISFVFFTRDRLNSALHLFDFIFFKSEPFLVGVGGMAVCFDCNLAFSIC